MVAISDSELKAVWGASVPEDTAQAGLMTRALASIQTLVETKPGTAHPNHAYYARLYQKSPHLLDDLGVKLMSDGRFSRLAAQPKRTS